MDTLTLYRPVGPAELALIERSGCRFGFGPKIADALGARPGGLLLHEDLMSSLLPPHAGMRQHWRDFVSLETWGRPEALRAWRRQVLRDSSGTGFWHEAYFMRGGMEAVYDDRVEDTGFLTFAPIVRATGRLFAARGRARHPGGETRPGANFDDLRVAAVFRRRVVSSVRFTSARAPM